MQQRNDTDEASIGRRCIAWCSQRRVVRAFIAASFVRKVAVVLCSAVTLSALIFWAYVGYLSVTVPVPDSGGIYTEAIIGQPTYYNPLLLRAGTETEASVTYLVYSGLFRADGSGGVVPDLAERVEVSDGGKTYTVTLRGDALWHDGERVTADDVVYTFNTIKDKRFAVTPALAQAWADVTVERVDDTTVRFRLTKPFASFVEAQLRTGILPKHIWRDVEGEAFSRAPANTHPIGTGPYRFVKNEVDERGRITAVTLVRFDDYYGTRPYISRVKFSFVHGADDARTALETHQVLAAAVRGVEDPDNAFRVVRVTVPSVYGVFFNPLKSAALAYADVRAALSRATDRTTIVREVLQGSVQEIRAPFVAPMAWNVHTDAWPTYDIAAARAMLDAAGWVPGEDGIRAREGTVLRFTLIVPSWGDMVKTAQELAKQWREVGADVTVEALDADAFRTALAQRTYNAVLFGQTYFAFGADPFAFWHGSQKDAPGLNFAQLTNKDIDKILSDAQAEGDPEKRAKYAATFNETLARLSPAVFLYSPFYTVTVSQKVHGMSDVAMSRGAERFVSIPQWYIAQKRVWHAPQWYQRWRKTD